MKLHEAKAWQKNPDSLKDPMIQYWLASGTMLGLRDLDEARAMVEHGLAFCIGDGAIGQYDIETAVETNNYRAKSARFGNSWCSGWLTKEQAIAKAKWFVAQWEAVGMTTRATVFYRDGSIVEHIDRNSLTPDVDNYEHAKRTQGI